VQAKSTEPEHEHARKYAAAAIDDWCEMPANELTMIASQGLTIEGFESRLLIAKREAEAITQRSLAAAKQRLLDDEVKNAAEAAQAIQDAEDRKAEEDLQQLEMLNTQRRLLTLSVGYDEYVEERTHKGAQLVLTVQKADAHKNYADAGL
jgi:hypothetical protein